MKEYPANFGVHLFVGPFGMVCSDTRSFQPARGPVKLLGNFQAAPRAHPPKDFDLHWAGLFVGKHCRI